MKYNELDKLDRMMEDFSVYNKKGVMAAKKMVGDGTFRSKKPSEYGIGEIFDRLVEMIEEDE